MNIRVYHDRYWDLYSPNDWEGYSWRENVSIISNIVPLACLLIEFSMNKIKIPSRAIIILSILLFAQIPIQYLADYIVTKGTNPTYNSNCNMACNNNRGWIVT